MIGRAFIALLISAGAAYAATPVNEINTAALVGPFDETANHQTFITVHAPEGVSPTSGLPKIITHWTFWSESCAHLADFFICLTKDDSVVVDPSDAHSIDEANQEIGSPIDLTGHRGLVTIHAFESDDRCRDPADADYTLIPNAINGTWSIANTSTHASFGDRFQSMEVVDGSVSVPDERFSAIDIPFFRPASLQASSVILIAVVENFGDLPGEIGPTQGLVNIVTRAKFFDNMEVGISLPDVVIPCVLFTSVIPGPDSLIPDTIDPQSGGFVRFSSPRFTDINAPIIPEDVWIYAYHGEQLGPYGTGARGTYTQAEEPVEPTPTPTSISPPTPTIPFATATPVPTASPTVTPGLTATPGVTPTTTATPADTPTPQNTVSVTPSLTPVGTGTPQPSQTPSPTSTPSPTAT